MAKIEGFCDPKFAKLKEQLEANLASGEELGFSAVVNVDGKDVVDLWGGYADEACTKPWEKDTITNVWSSTKTVAALAVLMAHDRGLLSVDDPVAKYWPEFAAQGKDKVLIRHLLSHTAGVSGWQEEMTAEKIWDVPAATASLAQQALFWEPGTASGYHAVTMGHLLGEVILRVTGKGMKQFVAEEIAGPAKADLQIGAAEKDWPRISPVLPPPPMPFDFSKLDPNGPTAKTFGNPVMDATKSTLPEWRRADMSAVNGHANARSLNHILSAIPNGGITSTGARLLSPATIERIFEVQADGTDLVIGLPLRFGIGFGLGGGSTATTLPFLPQEKTAFWGGWGGSLEILDVGRNVTFTYVMNKMGAGILGNSRSLEYVQTVWKCLDATEGNQGVAVHI